MRTAAKFGAAALLLLCFSATVNARPPLQRYEANEPHMGTMFRIILYAEDPETAAGAFRAGFDRVAQLDARLSDYRDDSELMQLCRRAGRETVTPSEDLYRVLAQAQQIAQESDGAFDVTVGPLTKLWRAARRERKLPGKEAVEGAKAKSGYGKITVANGTVRLAREDMQLDLGGIAKGFAADEALKKVQALGIASALVAASGDLAIGAAPPDQQGWRVAVDSGLHAAPEGYVLLKECAISTSGDSEQYLLSGGKRYSHILDPSTGMGLTERRAVSVIAKSAMDADALALACTVLGPARGLELLKKHPDAAALFVEPPRTVRSPGFHFGLY